MRKSIPFLWNSLFGLLLGACSDGAGPGETTGATSLAIAAGADQTGPVATSLNLPLAVRLTNATGSPVSGSAVQWTVEAGGGSINPQQSNTNAAGQANWVRSSR